MLTLKQKQKFNFTIMSPQLPPNDDPVPRLSSHPALVMGALHSGQDEGTSATQVTKYRVMTEKEVYVERFCDTLMHGQFLLCSKACITFCAKKKAENESHWLYLQSALATASGRNVESVRFINWRASAYHCTGNLLDAHPVLPIAC